MPAPPPLPPINVAQMEVAPIDPEEILLDAEVTFYDIEKEMNSTRAQIEVLQSALVSISRCDYEILQREHLKQFKAEMAKGEKNKEEKPMHSSSEDEDRVEDGGG